MSLSLSEAESYADRLPDAHFLSTALPVLLLSPAYKNYSRRACCASLPRSDTMFMSVWTLADRSMIYPVVGEE